MARVNHYQGRPLDESLICNIALLVEPRKEFQPSHWVPAERIMMHKMSHTSFEETGNCPIARTAALVGDMWTILIVRDLMHGPRRFGQLQESLGNVSPKTLSQRLKMLEHANILTRHAFAEIPPRVEYTLTEKGGALSHIIEAMREFGEEYLVEALPTIEEDPLDVAELIGK